MSDKEGGATGRMTFKGPIVIPKQDVDGAGYRGFTGKLEEFYVEAEFDRMVIDKNKSVMSGTVTGCAIAEYIGQRVLLTVEDNGFGDDAKDRDKSTWGFYTPTQITWTPTDSERKDGRRVAHVWWAMTPSAKTTWGSDEAGAPRSPPRASPFSTTRWGREVRGRRHQGSAVAASTRAPQRGVTERLAVTCG